MPPHNLDAERAVIGATLVNDHAVDVVTELLVPEDFYLETHRVIFDAVRRLAARSEKIDQLTLVDELRSVDEFDRVGGRAYIFEIVESVPMAASAGHYAQMVRDAAILRDVVDVGARIQEEGFRDWEDPATVLDRAEQLVYELNREESRGSGFADAQMLAGASLERIQQRYESQCEPAGIPTGFDALDRVMLGMEREEILVIGGRTAMGKTALGLSVLKSVSIDRGLPVAIFSLEMSKDQLSDRFVSMTSGVASQDLKTGRVRDQDWPRVVRGAEAVANAPLLIDDTAGISVAQMRPRLRRLSSRLASKGTPLAAVMVDYVQLMKDPEAARESRQQEVSAISRGLKTLAREFSVPVLVLAQMNRDTEKKGNKRPVLSELRDSGSLEQDADKVLLLYRDEYYNPDSEDKGIAEINVAKHRNGPTGTVKLAWVERQARFARLAWTAPI